METYSSVLFLDQEEDETRHPAQHIAEADSYVLGKTHRGRACRRAIHLLPIQWLPVLLLPVLWLSIRWLLWLPILLLPILLVGLIIGRSRLAALPVVCSRLLTTIGIGWWRVAGTSIATVAAILP